MLFIAPPFNQNGIDVIASGPEDLSIYPENNPPDSIDGLCTTLTDNAVLSEIKVIYEMTITFLFGDRHRKGWLL